MRQALDLKLQVHASKLKTVDLKLEGCQSKLEVRAKSFKFRVTVNLHLTGTVHKAIYNYVSHY